MSGHFGVDTLCLTGALLAWFSRRKKIIFLLLKILFSEKKEKMNAANRIFLRMKRKTADAGVCQTLMVYLAEMHTAQ
jgi:hypothetical protein